MQYADSDRPLLFKFSANGMSIDQISPPLPHRGTSLIRNTPLLGPYSRTMSRAMCWS